MRAGPDASKVGSLVRRILVDRSMVSAKVIGFLDVVDVGGTFVLHATRKIRPDNIHDTPNALSNPEKVGTSGLRLNGILLLEQQPSIRSTFDCRQLATGRLPWFLQSSRFEKDFC